jgi:hypothetical protein
MGFLQYCKTISKHFKTYLILHYLCKNCIIFRDNLCFANTVKPVKTTTSEQQSPIYNGQPYPKFFIIDVMKALELI